MQKKYLPSLKMGLFLGLGLVVGVGGGVRVVAKSIPENTEELVVISEVVENDGEDNLEVVENEEVLEIEQGESADAVDETAIEMENQLDVNKVESTDEKVALEENEVAFGEESKVETNAVTDDEEAKVETDGLIENEESETEMVFSASVKNEVPIANADFDEYPPGRGWYLTKCKIGSHDPHNFSLRGKTYRCGDTSYLPYNGEVQLLNTNYLISDPFVMPKVGQLTITLTYRSLYAYNGGVLNLTIRDLTTNKDYTVPLLRAGNYNPTGSLWADVSYNLIADGNNDFSFLSGHRVALLFDTLYSEYNAKAAVRLDKIKLETTIPTPEAQNAGSSKKLYRFWSANFRGHFFTTDYNEALKLATKDKNWKYEQVAYEVFDTQVAGTIPVYRFWSANYKGHFYTTSESEMNKTKKDKNWKYERIAFYVYPANYTGGSTMPVYRFWSKGYRHHFFTASESEMNKTKNDKNWKYERVAWRVKK